MQKFCGRAANESKRRPADLSRVLVGDIWAYRRDHRRRISLKRVAALALAVPLQAATPGAATCAEPLASFSTEKEAQEHCPGGLVVWLDATNRVYYFRGQQRYGSTSNGAYVCRDEAKNAGMRAVASGWPQLTLSGWR